MKSHRHFPDRGFTLIEVLIVITLASVIAGFGLVVGVDSYQRSTFRGHQDILVSVLQKGRSRALANIGQCNHVVEIKEKGYVITVQDDGICDTESVGEEVVEVSEDITFGGVSEIVFLRVSGDVDITNNEEEITLTDARRNVTARVIVGRNGRISWE